MTHTDPMSLAVGLAVAFFLAWAWLVSRRSAKDSNRRAAERRANPDRPTPTSSWDGSAEQQQLHAADQIRSWSSDSPHY